MRLFPLEERKDWDEFVHKMEAVQDKVTVAIVGKYTVGSQCADPMEDAYLSIRESLKHAAIEAGAKIEVLWIDAEELEKGSPDLILRDADGILVPGGFGSRGTEGKIKAIQYAESQGSLLSMLRNAAGGNRVRPQCMRPGGRKLNGVRGHASSRDRHSARAGEDQTDGRYHAPWRLSGSPD
jgi:hypothetical protein